MVVTRTVSIRPHVQLDIPSSCTHFSLGSNLNKFVDKGGQGLSGGTFVGRNEKTGLGLLFDGMGVIRRQVYDL
ncbi:hypothetical protein Hypma_005619 [Hypsizygus marmoreus]|uniref:Uncharacterized protein n=1 Tax=Hypsizygus marmoreus TaxID=39966 RepID=A0A369JZ85_HYPMA|nr:hypothetical protein Hypma_005619 [Hypsizygus marmoreus]